MDDRREIEEVRSRTDIASVIEPYVTLRRSGKNLKGLCPFHSEKTPSFYVDPEQGYWRCFGTCAEGGDVFKFLEKIENLTFPEALERLAMSAGVTLTRRASPGRSDGAETQESERTRLYRVNACALQYFRLSLQQNRPAQEYLERRGIAQATQDAFAVGFAPDSWDGLVQFLVRAKAPIDDAALAGLVGRSERGTWFDRMRGRVVFPIYDVQGRPIAFGGRIIGEARPDQPKYWNSPETPIFAKSRILYGLWRARKAIADAGRAVIVEGYTDVVTAHQAGFENVVATLGTSLTEEHVRILARLAPKVILGFDADSAGLNAAFRAGDIFAAHEMDVFVLDLPDGDDPDSLIRAGRRAEFLRAVDNAQPLVAYRLNRLLRRYGTDSDDDRVELFRKAIPVLASVASAIERERYMDLIAPRHPRYRVGTTIAEDQIRQEVLAYRARPMPRSGERQAATLGPVQQAANGAVQVGRPASDRIDRTERHLLLALCSGDAALAVPVLDGLNGMEFESPSGRMLAPELLRLARRYEGVMEMGAALAELPDRAACDALREIALSHVEPLNVRLVEDEVAALRERVLKRELAELKSLIDRGSADSEQQRRYGVLYTELRGTRRAGAASLGDVR